jgi:hypothetical protein
LMNLSTTPIQSPKRSRSSVWITKNVRPGVLNFWGHYVCRFKTFIIFKVSFKFALKCPFEFQESFCALSKTLNLSPRVIQIWVVEEGSLPGKEPVSFIHDSLRP